MRLQFSLRLLLLFTAAVGICLAIFRCPWEVTRVDTVATRKTGYRRGWDGQALQHGDDRLIITRTEQTTWEKRFVDGELVRERTYQPPGVLSEEKHFVAARGETRTRRIEDLGSEQLISESIYRERDHYFHEEWRTPTGELLESAVWQEGRLTTWNGQPFLSELTRLLGSLADWREREAWLQPRIERGATSVDQFGDATFRVRPCLGGRPGQYDLANQQLVTVHFGSAGEQRISDLEIYFLHTTLMVMGSREKIPSAKSLAEQLLRDLHRSNFTLRPRFGILSCVPISLASLHGDDPTGISKIQFERDSPQDRDWSRLAFPMRQKFAAHAERLQDFFANTSLSVNLSQVTGVDVRPLPNGHADQVIPQLSIPHDSPHLRPRRDLFGLFLSHNNYRVEQQGDQLVVLPRGN